MSVRTTMIAFIANLEGAVLWHRPQRLTFFGVFQLLRIKALSMRFDRSDSVFSNSVFHEKRDG
jgi:hypothetical protein